jgi:hypothetical protein
MPHIRAAAIQSRQIANRLLKGVAAGPDSKCLFEQ